MKTVNVGDIIEQLGKKWELIIKDNKSYWLRLDQPGGNEPYYSKNGTIEVGDCWTITPSKTKNFKSLYERLSG